MEQSAQRQI